MPKTNFIFATGNKESLALHARDRRYRSISIQLDWRAINITQACNHILRTVDREGFFQFRHYTSRNTKHTAVKHNVCLRNAAERLHREGRANIITRRPFSHTFDDGSMLGGVNVTIVSNKLMDYLPGWVG